MNGVDLQENSEKRETLLGIVIQNDLKWSSQVEVLAKKLNKRLVAIEKLRRVLSRRCKKMIVEGLFNGVLGYCLPLFGGCSGYELNTLQVLQNTAARVVLNVPPRSNRDYMFDQLNWLTVRQLIAYQTLVIIFRLRTEQEPEYLAQCVSQDNRLGHIVVRHSRLDLYRNSFVYRGSLLWNKLPVEIREEQNGKKFKETAKDWVCKNIDRFT